MGIEGAVKVICRGMGHSCLQMEMGSIEGLDSCMQNRGGAAGCKEETQQLQAEYVGVKVTGTGGRSTGQRRGVPQSQAEVSGSHRK